MIKSGTTFNLKIGSVQRLTSVIDVYARVWMAGWLFVMDFISVFMAFFVAAQVRGIHQLLANHNYLELFIVLVTILITLFYRKGLYPGVGVHYVDELRHVVSSTTLAYLILIGITYILKTSLIYSRFVLILAGILSLGLIPLSRYVIRRLLITWELWGEPALILGDSNKAQSLMEYFTLNMQLGIRPVAVLGDKQPPVTGNNFICPTLPICRIKLAAQQLSIKTILVMVDDINEVHQLGEKYRLLFHRVIFIKGQEDNYSFANLQTLDFLNIIGLQVKNDLLSRSSQITKRTLDLIGSFLGLLVLSPFLGLIVALIKLDSHGPVLYRQQRVGRNGVVFHLLKFRTMHYNSDQIFKEALETDMRLNQEWARYQKLKNDPRVTRIGRILRKFSIDEIPQLWNVLVGEMSLVGPRPFMLDQRKLYGGHIKHYIHVLPGMTGLWQVSGRNQTTFARRVELDHEYVQRWSLWLDAYIIFKTFKTVFFENNVY